MAYVEEQSPRIAGAINTHAHALASEWKRLTRLATVRISREHAKVMVMMTLGSEEPRLAVPGLFVRRRACSGNVTRP